MGLRSMTASRNVAIGPPISDPRNQAKPLRPFTCAMLALIKASDPHPTAYDSFIMCLEREL